ncbi:MAG: type II toxin-antitoxin system ParD family antitoxin [Bacteroidota bacterium]
MSTVRKSLTITQSQEDWIRLQIEKGGFANESEYLRHLIRMDEAQNRGYLMIKKAIQDGYNSGVSERTRTVEEIMQSALNRKATRTNEGH